MNITVSMIKDHISQRGCKILSESSRQKRPLAGVKLFNGFLEPDQLSIARSVDITTAVPEIADLISNEKNTVIGFVQDEFILVGNISLLDMMNMVMDAFQFYSHYENDLLRAIAKGADMQGMMDIAETYFANPAFIANWQGEVFALTRGFTDDHFRSAWDHIVSKRRLPLSSVQTLRRSPHYHTVTHASAASIFTFPDEDFTCIIGRLNKDLDYHLYLQIMQHQTLINESTLVMASAFIDAMNSIRLPDKSTSVSALFCDLLDGKALEQEKLDWVLESLGWVNCGNLLLLVFQSSEGSLTTEVLCGELKNQLMRGHCFIWKEHPIMIMRDADFIESKNEIEQVARELAFICGVSIPFPDLKHLPAYFKQAQAAIRFCTQADRISLCINHVWKYIFEQMDEITKMEQLHHPAVIELSNYDKRKNSQLLLTLYVYLESERSLTVTANNLFIHRNTLLHRLSRIHDVVQINLDDPDTRAHILYSCQTMKKHRNIQ